MVMLCQVTTRSGNAVLVMAKMVMLCQSQLEMVMLCQSQLETVMLGKYCIVMVELLLKNSAAATVFIGILWVLVAENK